MTVTDRFYITEAERQTLLASTKDPAPWSTGYKLGGQPYRTSHPNGWTGIRWDPRTEWSSSATEEGT